MLDSGMLGNDEKDIDVALPGEETGAAAPKDQPSRRERREAIAQARAIRREAAAKARTEKQQAAKAAKAVLAGADPEASRRAAAKKPAAPQAVRPNSGMFGWLDIPRKKQSPLWETERVEPTGEPAQPRITLPQTDPDAIIAEIVAEVNAQAEREKQRAAQAVTQPAVPAPAEEPDEDAEPDRTDAEALIGSSPRRTDIDTDALVAQIVAEAQAKAEAQKRANPPQADAETIAAEIMARQNAAKKAESPEAPAPALPEPEEPPLPKLSSGAAAIVSELRTGTPEITVEDTPEESRVTVTEKVVVKVPISPEEDPLGRALAAETVRQQEKKRAAEHAAEMEQADADYKAASKSAKRQVKKLSREAEQEWKKEAGEIAAKKREKRSRSISAVFNAVLCSVLLFGVAAGMVVLTRPTKSDIENRNLATMPEFTPEGYLDGSYTAGVAEYYNDTVPFRDTFKQITQTFRNYFGLKDDITLHGFMPTAAEETTAEPAATTTTATTPATTDPDMRVTTTAATSTTPAETEPAEEDQAEMSNNILIYQKRAISLYGGSFSAGEEYARALNGFKERLGENVNVYSMVVPTVCSYYMPEQFQDRAGLEKENIDHINENLVGVKPVDVYSALAKHTDEPIFMRTDHHWGALGAFYAAEEFSAAARVPFRPITDYEKVTLPGYVGTMYGYSGDITLKENPEDFNYYLPTVPYKNEYYDMRGQGGYEGNFFMNTDNMAPVSWYLVYMGGDNRIAHLETEAKNGRTLVIIKDSYGNALAPWFTSSFENIYVIDMRYFEGDIISYLKDIGTTDLLFAMNTFSATGPNRRHLAQMLH